MTTKHTTNFSDLLHIISHTKELGIKNLYFRDIEWNKDSEKVLWYKIDESNYWMYAYELVDGVMVKNKNIPGCTTFPICSMFGKFDFIVEH